MGKLPIQSLSLPVGLQPVTFTTTITKAVTKAVTGAGRAGTLHALTTMNRTAWHDLANPFFGFYCEGESGI